MGKLEYFGAVRCRGEGRGREGRGRGERLSGVEKSMERGLKGV